jgi:hypothetical protein
MTESSTSPEPNGEHGPARRRASRRAPRASPCRSIPSVGRWVTRSPSCRRSARNTANHHDAYDYARVTSVSGSTVGLSARRGSPIRRWTSETASWWRPRSQPHPERQHRGHARRTGSHHVRPHHGKPQQMSYFGTRWMGPRQPTGEELHGSVLGRYGLHFHMVGDASRGSNIVGGVVRDAGGHAFVAHESHGISFTSCISHDTFDDAYWWDGMIDTRTAGPDTNDVTYETCVASRVRCDPWFRGYRLSGFNLGAGSGNGARDCVAVGVQGNGHASGFIGRRAATGVWGLPRETSPTTTDAAASSPGRTRGILTSWRTSSVITTESLALITAPT